MVDHVDLVGAVLDDLLGVGRHVVADQDQPRSLLSRPRSYGGHRQQLKNRGDQLSVADFRVAPDALIERRVDGRAGGDDDFLFHRNRMENFRLVRLFAKLVAHGHAGAAEDALHFIDHGHLRPFDALGFIFCGRTGISMQVTGQTLAQYSVGGEQRMATAGDPQVPAALAGVIESISGLYTINNHPITERERREFRERCGFGITGYVDLNGGTCVYYVMLLDFVTIYDMTTAWNLGFKGAGQTIAIIGRSRVYLPDIENFENLSGLANKDPTVIVPPNGVDPGQAVGSGSASEDQLEATLDVMRSTSVAPGATIDLVVSKSSGGQDGIAIAAEYVVDTSPAPAHIMNISFGECEVNAGQAGVQFWDSVFSQAAAEGISVFVASGDAGAAGCDPYFQTPPQNQVPSPNYICSSSYSTCVGGTEFADTADPALYWGQSSSNGPPYALALSYIPEGRWNEPLSGSTTQAASSGGGFSSYIATPLWQTGTGVPGPGTVHA